MTSATLAAIRCFVKRRSAGSAASAAALDRTRARFRSQAGYSLVELLVSSAIMLTVTGSIFALVGPSTGMSASAPEVADLQQRMRVGSEMLFKELVMTGAGPYQGAVTGSLARFFSPILPRRTGRLNPDPVQTYRPDALTICYVPNTYAQSTLSAPMPQPSAELKVNQQSNCPANDPLCGFEEGMSLVIFDTSGNFDAFDVTQVQSPAAHLQHRGQQFNHEYAVGAQVLQIVSYTYYLDRNTNQLRRYNGNATDVPIVDNVVDMQLVYYGDPNPPTEPKPTAGTANCLYDEMGNFLNPGQLPADHGGLATLTKEILTDGPWCGAGDNAFDVDMLRVRKVAVTLRMQAGDEQFRGNDPAVFWNPGKAVLGEKLIPDYTVSFEVTPRNLNLTR